VLNIEGSDEIEKYWNDVRDNNIGWSPFVSAHQMGIDRATSCVHNNGKMWEVEGLFVSDATTFPTDHCSLHFSMSL